MHSKYNNMHTNRIVISLNYINNYIILRIDFILSDVLLQAMSGSPIDVMWYIDTGASRHMTGMKTFYHSLDKSHKGVLRFGDGSSIRYESKDEVHVDCKNDEHMIFENVFYIPKLKTNIFILVKLDSQGCDIHLRDGFLTLHDR